eukprot:Skav234529  [mRNA]  locus=scaffold2556:144623:146612:- [translate_table: standard]
MGLSSWPVKGGDGGRDWHQGFSSIEVPGKLPCFGGGVSDGWSATGLDLVSRGDSFVDAALDALSLYADAMDEEPPEPLPPEITISTAMCRAQHLSLSRHVFWRRHLARSFMPYGSLPVGQPAPVTFETQRRALVEEELQLRMQLSNEWFGVAISIG